MNHLFKNDDANTQGVAQFIAFFAISLVFSSVVVSWVLLNAYGVSVAGLDFPTLNPSTNYDFTSGNAHVNKTGFIGSPWSISSSGLSPSGTNSYVLFDGAIPNTDGSITNEYVIENPNMGDYSIILSNSWIRTNEIIVSSDGFHYPTNSWTGIFQGDDLFFYPYEGANQITNARIRTVYNINAEGEQNSLEFYLNDDLIFTMPSSVAYGGQTGIAQASKVYYGGVGNLDNTGLSVVSYTTSNDRSSNGLVSMLDSIQVWFITMVKLMVWNVPSEFLPWELNLLFIKSQAFCLGVGVAVWARG